MTTMQFITRALRIGAAALLLAALPTAWAQDKGMTPEQRRAEFEKLPWQNGPAKAAVGERASLQLPDKLKLLPESHGGRFLELTGNLPAPGHSILVGPSWWAVFSFDDIGYVKDDEKLDPDALLKSLKESDGPANDERRKRGLTPITTEGWAVPPHFDPDTKRLEWGLKLRAEGDTQSAINYTVRVLGRRGFENVVLVTGADTLDKDVAELKGLLKGFEFNGGERYAEFRPGDHVAEIGLGALVLGGAAAAAAKSGWFKGLLATLVAGWKLIAGLAVAGIAALGKLFGRKKSH